MSTTPKDRARMRGYYEEHREQVRAQQAAYREKLRGGPPRTPLTEEEKLAIRREQRTTQQTRIRREVIEGYGGRCVCCANDFLPHLTIDHIAGGGSAERKTPGGSQRSLYRRLRREGFPEGFQVLCWNCNWTKHLHGRCPCSDVED
jgi:hypothetical protein